MKVCQHPGENRVGCHKFCVACPDMAISPQDAITESSSPPETTAFDEVSVADINRRWHTFHDRGAHDYTDEGCRVLAEHAFRDIPVLLAELARRGLAN
jgi:hypothetical protein